MARDTRSLAEAKDAGALGADRSSPLHKRKRRTSTSPNPVSSNPLKFILPSPSSIAQSTGTSVINTSPPKANGEHEAKRQRISLKVSPNGLTESPVAEEKEEAVDSDPEGALPVKQPGQEELAAETSKTRPLSIEVRGALALIISRMAVGLPPPVNGILTLWLPPEFAPKRENTLGYVLRQKNLTWESLVGILHEFSENLLVPCSYPNPMPSLAQCRLPVPPLPSHYPPHAIYNFCASLHNLMLLVEPPSEGLPGQREERWALMQKTPSNGQAGLLGGEWFTAPVDIRAAEKARKRLNKDQDGVQGGLLEVFAANGDNFGQATVVSMSAAESSSSKPRLPKLSDTVIRRASLKMQRWKEQRAMKRGGGFGSIARGVVVTSLANTLFTPTFAPTFDSTSSTGGVGYYASLQAMHERARHKEWSRRVVRRSGAGNLEPEKEGWWGTMEAANDEEMQHVVTRGKAEGKVVDEVLTENVKMIEELQAWQEVRTRKGDETWIPQREQRVAEELLASLTSLAENVSPCDLLPKNGSTSNLGLAHDLTKRFIPVSSPLIRGTLDPRRPHALHDNTTVRLRPHAGQTLNSSPSVIFSPHTPPPVKTGSYGYMAPPPLPSQMSAPPPHVLPSSSSTRSQSPSQSASTAQTIQRSPQPYYSPQNSSSGASRPQSGSSYNPYTPNPINSAVQGRTTTNSVSAPTRPLPGPSSLRQSFGPSTPGSPYGTPAHVPAVNLMSQQQTRLYGTP